MDKDSKTRTLAFRNSSEMIQRTFQLLESKERKFSLRAYPPVSVSQHFQGPSARTSPTIFFTVRGTYFVFNDKSAKTLYAKGA